MTTAAPLYTNSSQVGAMHTVKIREGKAPFRYRGETHETWYKVFGDPDTPASNGHDQCALPPLVVVHGGPGMSHDYLLPLVDLAFSPPENMIDRDGKVCQSSGTPHGSYPLLRRAVIFYDQLGTARSAHPALVTKPESFWTLELFISELENLLLHFGLGVELGAGDTSAFPSATAPDSTTRIRDYDLLGHSWGGALASEFVLHLRSRLRLYKHNRPRQDHIDSIQTNQDTAISTPTHSRRIQLQPPRLLVLADVSAAAELRLRAGARLRQALPQDVQDALCGYEMANSAAESRNRNEGESGREEERGEAGTKTETEIRSPSPFHSPQYREAMRVFLRRHACRMDPFPDELIYSLRQSEDRSGGKIVNSALNKNVLLDNWDIRPRLAQLMPGSDHASRSNRQDKSLSLSTEQFLSTAPDTFETYPLALLLINGVHDFMTDDVSSPYFSLVRGKVRWVKFLQSSHSPQWEEREYFMKTVDEFLRCGDENGDRS